MKSRIFVASSVERLDLAYAAQENLDHKLEVTVWSQGIFQLSRTAMASLIDELDETDFGLFILAPDDVTAIRGKEKVTVRDNVIFELGLFVGRLGPERCFLIVPRGVEDLHLPTDLLGLAPATYDPDRQDGNLMAALGPACNRVEKAATKLGKFRVIEPPQVEELSGQSSELCTDPDDCTSLIQSWMGQRSSSQNVQVIRYADVDRELKLTPGSARTLIAKAASRYNYVVEREGKDTILFRKNPARSLRSF